jgi:hypothetical protein
MKWYEINYQVRHISTFSMWIMIFRPFNCIEFINLFHWYVQNAMIPRHYQEPLPFLCYVHFLELYKMGNFLYKNPKKMNFGSGKCYTWEFCMQDNFNIILMDVLAGLQIPNILHGNFLSGKKHGTVVAHITTTEVLVSWMSTVPINTYRHTVVTSVLTWHAVVKSVLTHPSLSWQIKFMVFLGYDTMKAGKWVPIFQWHLLPPLTSKWRQQIPPKYRNQSVDYTLPYPSRP